MFLSSSPLTDSKGVPGKGSGVGVAEDLCSPRSPRAGGLWRGCWGPMLPQVPTSRGSGAGLLRTYATPGPHEQGVCGGVAEDLCYPRSPRAGGLWRGCWGPMLPQVPTSRGSGVGLLRTYATPGPHEQGVWGGVAEDLCYPRPPRAGGLGLGLLRTYATPGPHEQGVCRVTRSKQQ